MSVEYSTMPRAFRGARSMSWMMALSGSLGSTSPCAMPTIFSNCPTLPKAAPPKVGDSIMVISILVIRPSAGLAKANDTANKDPSRYLVHKAFLFIASSNQWLYERAVHAAPSRDPGRALGDRSEERRVGKEWRSRRS